MSAHAPRRLGGETKLSRPRCAAAAAARRRTAPACSAARQQQQQPSPRELRRLLPRQAVAMAAASAVLGPLCDGMHGAAGVLRYAHPDVHLALQLPGGGAWSLTTCWWTPVLFAFAGVAIGVGVPGLDMLEAQQAQPGQAQQQQGQQGQQLQQQPPRTPRGAASWPACCACIAAFVGCYFLSAVLEAPLLDARLGAGGVPALDALLAAVALGSWATWDGTKSGAAMAALTAACGPAVEVALIARLHLYDYAHPAASFGGVVPSWLGYVYACGGVAVGSLGRVVWRELLAQARSEGSAREAP